MNLAERYKRWRHGRGFGVHSPLAYELIHEVLRDKPAYYADAEIDKMYPGKRERRIARIILRLTARFKPKCVYSTVEYEPVIKLADSRIEISPTAEGTDMEIRHADGIITVRVGEECPGHGPVTIDNLRDIRIAVYRQGLSETKVIAIL